MQNIFDYRIYENVYNAMITGKKNIEIRLLNEKSCKIKIGDKIRFSVVDSEKSLLVKVVDKYTFNNVDDLYKNKDAMLSSAINYTKDELEGNLYEIFGKENVLNSKLLGIKFEICKEA